MGRWDGRMRMASAVIVTAVLVATGASAAWSDGAPGEASTPTATASPEPATPTVPEVPATTTAPAAQAPATAPAKPATAASVFGTAHTSAAAAKAKAAAVAKQKAAKTAAAKKAAAKKAAAKKAAAKKAAAKKAAAKKAAAKKAAAKKAAAKKAAAKKAAAKKAAAKKAAVKAPAHVPSGGLVCRGSGGPGASEQKIAAIGAAINSFRKSHGRKALSIGRSSVLVNHAKRMATTGGIWHSGNENIVGCVSNDSAAYMVKAWAASPPHRQQMLRTDVHRMTVGGAVNDSWLFGAVRFS